MLYILNLHIVMHQLYLKKLEGKKNRAIQEKAAQTVSWNGNKTGGQMKLGLFSQPQAFCRPLKQDQVDICSRKREGKCILQPADLSPSCGLCCGEDSCCLASRDFYVMLNLYKTAEANPVLSVHIFSIGTFCSKCSVHFSVKRRMEWTGAQKNWILTSALLCDDGQVPQRFFNLLPFYNMKQLDNINVLFFFLAAKILKK